MNPKTTGENHEDTGTNQERKLAEIKESKKDKLINKWIHGTGRVLQAIVSVFIIIAVIQLLFVRVNIIIWTNGNGEPTGYTTIDGKSWTGIKKLIDNRIAAERLNHTGNALNLSLATPPYLLPETSNETST